MKIIQRIKQHFCHHIDDPRNRNKIMPFYGYAFQCPKCKGYVVCFENWSEYADIREYEYKLFVEEGKKIWDRQCAQEEKTCGDESL